MSTSKRRHRGGLWILLLLILLAIGAGGYWLWRQKNGTVQDPRLASLEKLVAASSVKPDFYFENGFPRWFNGRVAIAGADSVERARNFLEAYKDVYWQSDPNLALQVQKTSGAEDEFVVFYQTYKGLQVYGGQILVMLDGGEVVGTLGPLLPADLVIDTRPIIEAGEAESLARLALEAPEAPLVGQTTPFIYDPALLGAGTRAPRLAWQVTLRPGDTWNVLVDSRTGEILIKNVLAWEEYSLDLEDANYNSADNSSCYWTTTDDDWIGDEDGILVDYLGDGEATNTWWHAKNTYYFYLNTFGVDGYDLDEGVVEVYVHANVPNARWSEGPGCDLIEFRDGWVSWDVMTHEYTHGVISHTSQLGGSGQAGSLAECFGDTMAMLADSADWDMGEDRTNGQGPNRHYDSFARWHMDQYNANQDIYSNMGIPCTAGYKLAVGGLHNHWPVTAVGRSAMVSLFYNVMVQIPNGDSVTFMDARNLAVSLATANWSAVDVCAVKNAFSAVGLGEGDWECDGIPDADLTDSDADWHIDSKDNCPDIYNPYQEDQDGDGVGNACDNDDDNDGVIDNLDNCPLHHNPTQSDVDGDGKGDACDDEDHDGVSDAYDNCLGVPNSNQNDKDDDGIGDACDNDLDGDGVIDYNRRGDPVDNCLYVSNPDQGDADGDGIGDACDDCPDTPDAPTGSSFVTQEMLNLGIYPQPYQPDSDGDGIPDACDTNAKAKKKPWWDGMLDDILEVEKADVKIQLDSGEPLRVPLPICPFDRDGWYSQGIRQRLILSDSGALPGMWVTDDTGRLIASPRMADGQVLLEYRPRSDRRFFLNFIQPAGAERNEFDLFLSLTCLTKAVQPTYTPAPFNPEVIGSLVSRPLPTFTPTWTPLATFTLTPTLTLTPTATHRPWPTLTFTPTITPYIPPSCSQYKTRETCVAAGCTWVPVAGAPGYCK